MTIKTIPLTKEEPPRAVGLHDDVDFRKAIEPLAEKEDELHPTLGERCEGLRHTVVEKAEDIKTIVVEKTGEVKHTVVEKAGGIKTIVVEKTGEVKHTVVEKAEDIKTIVVEKAGEVRRSVGGMLEKHKHENDEHIPEEESASKDVAPTTPVKHDNGTIGERFEEVKHTVVEKAEGIKTIVVEKAGEVRRSVGGMLEKRKQEHDEHAPDEQETASKDVAPSSPVKDSIEAARSWITHKVEDFVDLIQVEKHPPGNERRLSKDLVEIVDADVHAETKEAQGGFQEKVEQARDGLTSEASGGNTH